MRSVPLSLLLLAVLVMPVGVPAGELVLYASAEFTPRDISPRDGVADVFVGGDPNEYKFLFIKSPTEDRACAEFDLSSFDADCDVLSARLRFRIRTLDDGIEPGDLVEVKAYPANGLPDLADFDPPTGEIVVIFEGPTSNENDPNACVSYYADWTLDVTDALRSAVAQQWPYIGFVFRDTVDYAHRYELYSDTWGCEPPSNCCEEEYIHVEITYGLIGDLDDDGDVDLADLSLLLSAYPGSGPTGDLDGDGDVDLADLALLLSRYGRSCAGD